MKTNNKILVVDDSEEHLLLIRDIYRAQGYDLHCARNGEEALAELKSGSTLPAFILLDLTMPVMDGYAFREAQMQDEALSKIPVVIFTADGQVEKKTMQMGVAGYIKKPFAVSRLVEEAKRFCG